MFPWDSVDGMHFTNGNDTSSMATLLFWMTKPILKSDLRDKFNPATN